MTSATMVEVKPPAHAKPGTSPHPHPHSHSPGPPPPQHHPQQPLPTAPVPPRVHTLDLKAKLAAALGTNGKRYWDALLRFSTAKISRDEFEDEARSCLRSEHVHLHNALVLGILYNASSAVPGPSSASALGYPGASSTDTSAHPDGHSEQGPHGSGGQGTDDAHGDEHPAVPLHPRKRLRLLTASLATNERQRLKASGKPLARNLANGASASSWAGAGADLLERKRKEEEKRHKEQEKKRLREAHTHIGSTDWTREVLAEEATRQENRPKLTVATLQALLRSNKVPTCIEAKRLPDADALADLMTSQAVEAGLNGGVAPEAAALLLAGVQAHLQNVASSMILAVRANRAAGGIRTSGHARHRSRDAGDTVGDDGIRTSYPASPLEGAPPQLPDGDGVPSYAASYPAIRMHRPERSAHSSRNSSSSNSASTVVSSIFTTGSAGAPQKRYMQTGTGPDASTISFASTAPTTHVEEDTPAGSTDGMDVDREGELAAGKLGGGVGGVGGGDGGDGDESTDSRADDSGVVISDVWPAKTAAVQPQPLPNRPLYRSGSRKRRRSNDGAAGLGAGVRGGSRKLGLRDVAFLLELSPHVLVEPFGVGAMEKLLAPDTDDGVAHDENLPGDLGGGSDLDVVNADADLGPEERLALAARLSAFSKQGGSVGSGLADTQNSSAGAGTGAAAPPSSASALARNKYLVDQQGPLSLLLARSVLAERGRNQNHADASTGAGAGVAAGALDAEKDKDKAQSQPQPQPQSGQKRPRSAAAHLDPLSDVVDPVKLLAGLCD